MDLNKVMGFMGVLGYKHILSLITIAQPFWEALVVGGHLGRCKLEKINGRKRDWEVENAHVLS